MMKKLSGLVVVSLATIVLIIACRSDVILPPAPSLVGFYTGTYAIIKGQGANAITKEQVIRFDFTDTQWHMNMDTLSSDYNPDVCLCNAYGSYVVTDRVRLVPQDPERSSPAKGCSACDPHEKPSGLYTLQQPAGGIKLTWIQTINDTVVTSQLNLTRITQ